MEPFQIINRSVEVIDQSEPSILVLYTGTLYLANIPLSYLPDPIEFGAKTPDEALQARRDYDPRSNLPDPRLAPLLRRTLQSMMDISLIDYNDLDLWFRNLPDLRTGNDSTDLSMIVEDFSTLLITLQIPKTIEGVRAQTRFESYNHENATAASVFFDGVWSTYTYSAGDSECLRLTGDSDNETVGINHISLIVRYPDRLA